MKTIGKTYIPAYLLFKKTRAEGKVYKKTTCPLLKVW